MKYLMKSLTYLVVISSLKKDGKYLISCVLMLQIETGWHFWIWDGDLLVWIALGIGDELIVCPAKHEGREIINVVLPMSVDELFTLLFTNSTFYMDYLTNTLKSTGKHTTLSGVLCVCVENWITSI